MKEGNCVLPKGSPGLHSDWDEVMVVRDFPVNFPLSSLSYICHPSGARHGYVDVGSCHCVLACGIPNEKLTLGPSSDGHFIGVFTIGLFKGLENMK